MRDRREPPLAGARRGRGLARRGSTGLLGHLADPPARRSRSCVFATAGRARRPSRGSRRLRGRAGAGRGRAVAPAAGARRVDLAGRWRPGGRRRRRPPPPRRHHAVGAGRPGDADDPRPPAARACPSTSRRSSAPTCGPASARRSRAARLVTAVSEFTRDDVVRPPRRPRRPPVWSRRRRSTPTRHRPAADVDDVVDRLPARPAVVPVPGHHLPPQGPRHRSSVPSPTVPDACSCSPAAPGPRRPRCGPWPSGSGVADRVRRPGRVAGRPPRRSLPWRRGLHLPVAASRPSACPVLEAMARGVPGRGRRRHRAARRWSATPASSSPPGDAAAWAAAHAPPAGDDAAHGPSSSRPAARRVGGWAPAASAARLVEAWRAGRHVRADAHPRPLPPLRARHRAHGHGDDPDRRRARRPRAPRSTSSPPLPWYRHHAVEQGWSGKLVRHERPAVGAHHPPAPVPDRQDATSRRGPWRSAGSPAEAAVVGGASPGAGPTSCWPCRRRSPSASPAGPWPALRRAPFVFNIQDVFPDAAVETGTLTDPRVIAAASRLERVSYQAADAVTVLSDDLRDNVVAKLAGHRRRRRRQGAGHPQLRRHRPPSRPAPPTAHYRQELGLAGKTVVLYAGNVGFSQSLDLVRRGGPPARRPPPGRRVPRQRRRQRPGPTLEAAAAPGLPNVRFGDFQPADRLADVLADRRHPPRAAQARAWPRPASRRSCTRSSPPAGRCWPASTRAPRWPAPSRPAGAGVAVPPEDPDAFCAALDRAARRPRRAVGDGGAGPAVRRGWASPAAVAAQLRGAVRGAAGPPGRPTRLPDRGPPR